MPTQAKLEHNNFTAGELSPWLRNRTNLDRYTAGLALCRNFVLIPEGGVTRRPGSRMVLPLKTESQVGRLIPFRFSGSDSYMLVLNGGVIRFLRNGGFILSGPNPYELAMPWAAADLANIRWAQEGNAAWIACRGFEPRELRRLAHDSWTLSLYRPTGGPVKIQNLDNTKTILASAATGTVTLTGVGTAFASTHIGSVWRLDESELSLIANWKANEAVTIPEEEIPAAGATNIGDMTGGGGLAAAFDGNTGTQASRSGVTSAYVGRTYPTPQKLKSVKLTDCSAGGTLGGRFEIFGKAGGVPANALDGTKIGEFVASSTLSNTTIHISSQSSWDHIWVRFVHTASSTFSAVEIDFNRYTATGQLVLRRYNGNVYEAISGTNTGVAPPVHTEGDVLSETGGVVWRYIHGPYGFVRITAVASATSATAEVLKRLPSSILQVPTYRWWEGAWNGADGWPEGVLLVDRGLLWWRGREFWMSTVDQVNDFEVTALADSAIAQALRSRDGSLPTIEWALDNGVIVFGCRDNEIIVRAPQTFDPITQTNIRAPPGSKKGSAPQVAAGLEDGAIFISRSRKRLFYVAFDPDTQKLAPSEVSISGRHLLEPRASELGWQPDPWNVLWGCAQNGSLFGLTFNIEHKIAGLHSHALVNGFVEDVKAIPSSDDGVSEVYLIVRRVINGVTRRFAEQLGGYFSAANVPATMIAAAAGTPIGDMTAGGGLAAAFDGDTSELAAGVLAQKLNTVNGYAGKIFASPLRISRAEVFGASDAGFTTAANVRLTLYGKQGTTPPAHVLDGTALGTTGTIADTSGMVTITNTVNPTGEWKYVWIALEPDPPPATINLVEAQFFTAAPGAVGAWFFDSALEYNGPAVSTITGLTHLIGETVGVVTDYAVHARKVVNASGQVILDAPASNAVIGLPIDARITDLPRNINLREGTSKGARKRASHALIDLVDTIGGALSCNGGRSESLELTGQSNYGAPPLLFSGMVRRMMIGPLRDEAEITLAATDGMPMTITGLGPELDIVEE